MATRISFPSKTAYLQAVSVKAFVAHLASLIDGTGLRVAHEFGIRDRNVYDAYPYWVALENGERGIRITTLEEAFDRYWWAGESYAQNASKLASVQRAVRAAALLPAGQEEAQEAYLSALAEVLEWGAGGKRMKLYTANMEWAVSRAGNLATLLCAGVHEINSDTPDLDVFADPHGMRMNAGLTKFFALACDASIIYDGRVGAALGLLVRKFCEQHELETVPDELAFRWEPQTGKNPLKRDASSGALRFSRIRGRSRTWAAWNIRANWVLSAALDLARHMPGSQWCSGIDGLRRVEAALFTMGYQIPCRPAAGYRDSINSPSGEASRTRGSWNASEPCPDSA